MYRLDGDEKRPLEMMPITFTTDLSLFPVVFSFLHKTIGASRVGVENEVIPSRSLK